MNDLAKLGQEPLKVHTRPWTYSVSQVNQVEGCDRSYHFKYKLGYKPEADAAQALGDGAHRTADAILTKKEIPKDIDDRGRLLGYKLVENLPDLENEFWSEGRAYFPVDPKKPDGAQFVVIIDLLERNPDGIPRVTDHKTTLDLKWAKTEYELNQDIQGNTYSYWALERSGAFDDADVCEFAHNVVQSRGPAKGRYTPTILSRDGVKKTWAKLLPIIARMDEIRAEPDVREIPTTGKDKGTCEKYRGCPYLSMCSAADYGKEIEMFRPPDAPEPTGQLPEKPEKEEKMDINKRLAAMKEDEKNGGKTEDAPPAPVVDSPPAPVGDTPPPPEKPEKKARKARQPKGTKAGKATFAIPEMTELAVALVAERAVTGVEYGTGGAVIRLGGTK